jgi:hypothetical protein
MHRTQNVYVSFSLNSRLKHVPCHQTFSHLCSGVLQKHKFNMCSIVVRFLPNLDCVDSSVECSSVKRRRICYYLWTEGRTERRAEKYAKNRSVYSCVASVPVNGSPIDVCMYVFVHFCICLFTYLCLWLCIYLQRGRKVLGLIFFLNRRHVPLLFKTRPISLYTDFCAAVQFLKSCRNSSFWTFFNSSVTASWISATSAKRSPFNLIFNFGNRK